ncbi:putative IRON-SULFUR-BINDING REDUCTASE domain protein, partial [Mycobacterium xenopi 4042]
FILLTVYIEAYGLLFQPNSTSRSSAAGRPGLPAGLLRDGRIRRISTFAVIRIMRSPRENRRTSRFYGSHTGAPG